MRTMFIAAAALIAAMASLSGARPALAAVGTVEEEIAKIVALAEAARAADVSKEVKSLFEADLAFAEDARARHVSDAFADRFIPDGKTFPLGRPIVVGPESVREAMKGSKAEWYWAPVEGKADDTLGVTWGRAFLVVRGTNGEEDSTYRGRYVTVWTRESKKDDWKIWLDLGTEASPEE